MQNVIERFKDTPLLAALFAIDAAMALEHDSKVESLQVAIEGKTCTVGIYRTAGVPCVTLGIRFYPVTAPTFERTVAELAAAMRDRAV